MADQEHSAKRQKGEQVAATKRQEVEWKQKCVVEFELQEVPSEWGVDVAPADDNDTWKKYYEYRKEIQEKYDSETEADEYDEEDLMDLTAAFRGKLRQVATDIGYEPWMKHALPFFDDPDLVVFENSDSLRDGVYNAIIFSPYAIPRAIFLEHQYHHRTRWESIEWYVNWQFRLVHFSKEGRGTGTVPSKLVGGAYFGDETTERLAKLYPEDAPLEESRYNAENGLELLCNNGLLHPPEVRGETFWRDIEDMDVQGFTPTNIRRIRSWLFGSIKSQSVLTDIDLFRLVFASMGTPGFSTLIGDVGHVWNPYHSEEAKRLMRAEGLQNSFLNDDDEDDNRDDDDEDLCLNWLEYQARLVSGALRPTDYFYEPFDIVEAKSAWGRDVLLRMDDLVEDENDEFLEDGETMDDLVRYPWVMWSRANESNPSQLLMNFMSSLRS